MSKFLTDLQDQLRQVNELRDIVTNKSEVDCSSKTIEEVADVVNEKLGLIEDPLGKPDADMKWLKSIGDNDVQEGFTKKLVIAISDLTATTDITLFNSNVQAVKTSDGAYYTESTIHTWDDTNAHQSQVDPNIKYRWMILYYPDSTTYMGESQLVDYDPSYIYAMNGEFRLFQCYKQYFTCKVIGVDANTSNIINIGAYNSNCELNNFPSLKYINNFYISSLSNNLLGYQYTLEYLPYLDVSQLSTDGKYGLFLNNSALKKVDNLNLGTNSYIQSWFSGCHNLQDQCIYDFSNITQMSSAYSSCKCLKQIDIDTSKVENLNGAFASCSSLEKISPINLQNCTDASSMFSHCMSLKNVKLLNTENVSDFRYMFSNCLRLENVSSLDVSGATSLYSSFYNCQSLKSVGLINTGNVTDFYWTFYICENIETISTLDLYSATNVRWLFLFCSKLKNLTVKNVKTLNNAGIHTAYELTQESLINLIQELWDYSSDAASHTVQLGSQLLSKITGTYVKLIDITSEMLEVDPYADQKKPCEVCESTDEGAMLLSEYATLKNWTLSS